MARTGRPKTGRTMRDAWEKVNTGSIDECWEWQGTRFSNNYGAFFLDGKTMKAHRVIFYLENDDWPEMVMHLCDNPPCCNPHHLRGGSNSENQIDSVSKGRHGQTRKTHCVRGHEYSERNTGYYSNGSRYCKECNRLKHQQEHYKKKRRKR